MTDAALPIVGIPACVKRINDFFDFHAVGDSFIAAVAEGANALPLIIPALGDWHNAQALVRRVDGLLLTGSPSNIEPHHYQGEPSRPDTIHDPKRDATTLPLIRAAVAAGVPVLAICRGLQELNVALGGTLHQNVHELPGRMDHRSDKSKPIAERFGPCHPVRLAEDGVLARLAGGTEIIVNSLHAQGIDRLAPGLAVEAVAPDGTIEAVRVDGARGFALGVQWHPERWFREESASKALFKAFGEAVHTHSTRRMMAPERAA